MIRHKKISGFLILSLLAAIISGCGDKGGITDPTEPAPTVLSVTPGEGAVGTELTITGSNFTSSMTVSVGGVEAIGFEFSSSSTIFANVPSGIEGNVSLDVTVRNPDGKEFTVENAFTAIDPELKFVNSATKPSGNTGSTVILEGRAFGDIQGDSRVLFSGGSGGVIPATIAGADDWTDTFIVTTVPEGAEEGPVYIETEIGISDSLIFTVTDAAIFSPSAIEWTITASLPVAVSGHKAVYTPLINLNDEMEQYVIVTGGRDSEGSSQNKTLYGRIDSDGQIISWNETTPLPEALSFHATVSATPFNSKVTSSAGAVYVLGGTNSDGEPVSTVSIAALQNDGTISSWRSGTPLPEPLHSLGAVVFRSTIYIGGGATVDNVPVAKVYKADIDTTGDIGNWKELASLPSARSYHGFLSFGGFLYSVGGESASVAPDGESQNRLD
ncbi:MAG: IPT/TIG domain-containing protein, partial [Balneolaceae bacterium]